MQLKIELVSPEWLPNRAAEMTTHGGTVKAGMRSWCRSEHSPLRCEMFWLELHGIPTFVSVHLVRHKHGVEHFVMSNRDDRGGDGDDVTNRNTPVNHGMLVNSQALITMSRKRLCYNAHRKTVAVWRKLRKAMIEQGHVVGEFMVPECVYRNGYCPELKMCKPGLEKVMAAYEKQKTPEQNKPEYPHYAFSYAGVKLDPYRILSVYGVTDPAIQHAIKKLLRAGKGDKSLHRDILEARDTLNRCLEMMQEDVAKTVVERG